MKKRKKYQSGLACECYKGKHGYIANCCGFRLAYNHFMKFCPYCGKNLRAISEVTHNDMKGEFEDEYYY